MQKSEPDKKSLAMQKELSQKKNELAIANRNRKLSDEQLAKANKQILELKDKLEKLEKDNKAILLSRKNTLISKSNQVTTLEAQIKQLTADKEKAEETSRNMHLNN